MTSGHGVVDGRVRDEQAATLPGAGVGAAEEAARDAYEDFEGELNGDRQLEGEVRVSAEGEMMVRSRSPGPGHKGAHAFNRLRNARGVTRRTPSHSPTAKR